MNADDFLDAPSADDFLSEAPATTTKRKPIIGGRGNAPTSAPVRFESVLQQPGNAEAFAGAPDPTENARALFNALKGNPELVKSPMYAAGAAALEQQATGQPSSAVAAFRKNSDNQRRRAQKDRAIADARAQTDAAYGDNPVVQAIAAPGRRLLSGAASVVGGVAGIPQLFGSDMGRETAEAASLMSAANMPADPGIADEVLAGVGQVGPMIGGAAAVRAALAPILGEAAATALATSASGAAGGALTGGEVLRDLEFRGDLSESDKRQRAGLAALFSGVTGKYADRFLLPGADKAATGVLNAGGRAFVTEGGQEMLDQMGQNVATDKSIGEGALRAGLVGGLVGGGTRAVSEVGSDATQLANAINADAQALANGPTPQTVWAPTESRVAPPLAPQAVQPAGEMTDADVGLSAATAPAAPSAAEFLDGSASQQEVQPAPAPAASQPQEAQAQPEQTAPAVEPELRQRLVDNGWTPPPESTNASTTDGSRINPAPAPADANAAPASPPVAGVASPDGVDGQDGLRAGEPDAALTRPVAGAPEISRTAENQQVVQEPPAPPRAAAPVAQVTANTTSAAVAPAVQEPVAREPAQAPAPAPQPAPPARADAEEVQFSKAGRTVEVDGKRRPVENSKGQPVGGTPEEQASFWRWAGDTKAVDENGKPLVLLHGTRGNFGEFDQGRFSTTDEGTTGAGIYATTDKDFANAYTVDSKDNGDGGNVMPLYMSVKNPIDFDEATRMRQDIIDEMVAKGTPEYRAEQLSGKALTMRLMKMGYDGVTPGFDGAWVAFDPSQVKSAIGNSGTFDANEPDIRKSEGSGGTSTAASIRTELRERFGNVIDRLEKRGLLNLWDNIEAYNAAPSKASKLSSDYAGTQGLYSHSTHTAHLFGDGVEPGKAVAVFLHEVGEHASMKAMLGDKRYADLVRRAHRLVADGDELAEIAKLRIPDDTPRQFHDSELVAYMIEEAATREGKMSPAARSWLADVLAAVRAWFYQTGFAKQLERYGVKLDMTPKDIAALAERAVRWQAEQGGETRQSTDAQPAFSKAPATDSEAFRRWFGDSKIVDSKGKPLVVYHGTTADFDSFRVSEDGNLGPGIYLTSSRQDASDYAIEASLAVSEEHAGNPNVRPVYASIKNPLILSAEYAEPMDLGDRLRPEHDGIWLKLPTGDEIVAFRPEQIKSAIGNNGEFDPANPDIRYSKKPAVSATGSNATAGQLFGPQPWTVAEPGTWDNIVRTMQNNKVDLKRVRSSIEERFGRIPDAKDAYLSEELYHGKVSARVEKLHTEAVEPILRKIAVAGKNFDVTLDDVNRYLHARHAPERNAAMAAINPGMANNQALSGMSDADAAQAMQEFGRAGKTPALDLIAKDIDKLLGDTRTNLVADGLEEAGTVQAWEQAYKHYVPLMRDVENAPAKGKGFNVKGPEAKRAMGSNRQAVNILANIVTQAETAAIRAEKADVGRTLLQMAKAYPNADFWKVDTPPTKPRINPTTGLVERSAVDPLYQTADNVVMVKEYGAVRFIVFNEDNARAMEVAKAMKNLEVQQVPKLLRYVGMGTRFIASLLTQRNPEFWFTNFARDLQGSAIQMNGTDAEGLQAKVLGYLPKALAGMRNVARATGKSTQWTRYAEELKEAGGTTGYMQMFENSDDRMKDLQKEVDRMGQGKADPRKLARSLLEFVDDYNDVIENGMRLAVFQAAREAGVSTARAAAIAKNITVNFNRKGNATPFVNSLYMFFNAGVQGSARLAEALATSNKARAVVGALAGAAFVMDIVNRAMAGDDDETKRNRYDLINEFEKSRNWIVMLPDGKYVKVPLPLGFHIFHNAGRLIADAFNRKDPRNAAEYGWAFASTVLDAFNPLGNVASVGQLLAPSVLDPVVQLAENKNFMGGKVYRDDDQGFGKTDPRPAYQRYFETTPDFWKAASKTLNDITGGDKIKPGKINIEPDILRHVWGAITGGPGRALDKSVDTVQAKARGEEITPARIPFAHRFLGEIGDRQQDSAYFEDLKRAAKAKDQFDYFVKNNRRQEAIEILKEIGDGDVARGRQVLAKFAAAKKGEMAINKRLKQLREQESDDVAVTEQMKALKQQRAAGRHRVLKNTAADEGE